MSGGGNDGWPHPWHQVSDELKVQGFQGLGDGALNFDRGKVRVASQSGVDMFLSSRLLLESLAAKMHRFAVRGSFQLQPAAAGKFKILPQKSASGKSDMVPSSGCSRSSSEMASDPSMRCCAAGARSSALMRAFMMELPYSCTGSRASKLYSTSYPSCALWVCWVGGA